MWQLKIKLKFLSKVLITVKQEHVYALKTTAFHYLQLNRMVLPPVTVNHKIQMNADKMLINSWFAS